MVITDTYVPYHLHTHFSNGVTNIDSVTRPEQYIARAADYGMKALAFSEHGNIFNWFGKKTAIEAAGMKYIHAAEVYVTETLKSENGEVFKVRDNYHCVLIARNFEGFKELNQLTSNAFIREDGHFYYTPRITLDELANTSENIIVTTACLGGLLGKSEGECREKILRFLKNNKERCFLEVQHHLDVNQAELNRSLLELSNRYGLKLIAGTDTHALDDAAVECRAVMQRAKDVHFDGEDNFDYTFKSLPELIAAYRKQNALPETAYMGAIDNTNLMAEMVEPFDLDKSPKYPHISDNPDAAFDTAIELELTRHPRLFEKHSESEIRQRIETEKQVFQKTKSVEYMLLYYDIVKWCNERDIYAGPGRGSAAGSLVSYLMGITDVDPLEYNLNFWRFMNPDRVSLCDIDRDYFTDDREKLFEYILRDNLGRDNIQTCKIITYNTLGLRGAIKDVGRALGMTPKETDEISKQEVDGDVPPELRKKYPELFRYVDGVVGTIVSVGQHAAGVVICDDTADLATNIGLCSSGSTPYMVSAIDMKQLDALNYCKYDLLGLDYIGLINETCRRAGIPRLTPDTVDLNDDEVWASLQKDTTLIFQFSEKYAQKYVSNILSQKSLEESAKYDDNISRFNRLALASAMLRPGAASVRDEAARGIYQQYPIEELNELLKPAMGTLVLQETLMEFLVKFCGYSASDSDFCRKSIAKKRGTEDLIPRIRNAFLQYTPSHYNVSYETADRMIDGFLQTVLDSASYSFSWNHSVPYTMISYMCAYLRVHYPLEFFATAIDIFRDDAEQLTAIMEYTRANKIEIMPARYGKSRAISAVDKELKAIYQSIAPVKNVSVKTADAMYELSKNNYRYFIDLLEATRGTGINSAMITNLILIDFFEQFGNEAELTRILALWGENRDRKTLNDQRIEEMHLTAVDGFATNLNAKGKPLKNYTVFDRDGYLHAIEDAVKAQGLPDYADSYKIENQLALLKRVDLKTGKEADRFKLYITDLRPLKRKSDGEVWGYSASAVSLGRGSTNSFTIHNRLFELHPIRKGSIILSDKNNFGKSKTGYLNIYGYTVLEA